MKRSAKDWDVTGNGGVDPFGEVAIDMSKAIPIELWSSDGVHYATADALTGELTIHDQEVYDREMARPLDYPTYVHSE